jgi:hypothetical protein
MRTSRMRLLALVQSRSGFWVYFELNTIITSPNFYLMPETIKSSVLWNSSARRARKTRFFHSITQATKLLAPLIHCWCSTRTATIYDGLLYTCFTCILVRYISVLDTTLHNVQKLHEAACGPCGFCASCLLVRWRPEETAFENTWTLFQDEYSEEFRRGPTIMKDSLLTNKTRSLSIVNFDSVYQVADSLLSSISEKWPSCSPRL